MIWKCVIRAAKREDMAAVADMIRELAVFHKMPEQAQLTAKGIMWHKRTIQGIDDGGGCLVLHLASPAVTTLLEHDGFKRQPPAFCCKVAEIGQAVVGYTMYFPAYSSWTGRAILLEDLYVLKAHRKKGIGEQLFDAVAKEAVTTGCTRVDFHVVEWNKALTFYEDKGAVNLTKKEKWCYFRLSGDALKRFAKK